MKRLSTLVAAAALLAPAAAHLGCAAEEEDILYDGEGVKSGEGDDGKSDASALAVFMDFTFSGKFKVSSRPWNMTQAIQDHLLYTIGHLNEDNSVGRLDKLEVLESNTVTEGGGTFVTYKVKLPVAWGDKANPPTSYTFTLPTSQESAFLTQFATDYGHSCVDFGAHDVDSGSMWYYYRPGRSGCTFASGATYKAEVAVARSPINTTGKFPEFNKVWEDNEFNVLAIFGKYEDGATTGDAGISAYNTFIGSVRTDLRARGTVTSVPATVPTTPGVGTPDISFSVTTADGKKINVTALLTDNVQVGLSQPAFRARYEALSTRADYIVYNGHAGLGSNVRALARNGKWVAGQYTVVFINGCDTFAYIDSALNDAHKAVNPDDTTGYKYIDIVTNAMPSFFSSMSGATMSLYRGLIDQANPKTYEQIFAGVDRSQVILVSGEQDNTFVPGGGGGGGTGAWGGLDEDGTVARGATKKYVTPTLAAGRYKFAMTGTSDADLYVRIGREPTTSTYDCRPYKNGSNETCVVNLPADAKIYVNVRGYASSSDFSLVGSKE
jgi:hypothetical protein